MRIVIKNVYICHLVTMAGFPLRYITSPGTEKC